jgi:glycine betaine/proline transport system ATP-binding protein
LAISVSTDDAVQAFSTSLIVFLSPVAGAAGAAASAMSVDAAVAASVPAAVSVFVELGELEPHAATPRTAASDRVNESTGRERRMWIPLDLVVACGKQRPTSVPYSGPGLRGGTRVVCRVAQSGRRQGPVRRIAHCGACRMIDVRNVWKVFGAARPDVAIDLAVAGADRASVLAQTGATIGVRDVSFHVAKGETFVVMGLSGSGKSTLIRCLAGLHDVTRGEITIDDTPLVGIDPARLRELRRTKMAMVFQHFGLFPHRKVIDNVAYGLEVQGVAKAERRRKAGEIIDLVGLNGWADRYPDQLSGGMQQRVGLARALALDPEILFFDEPFSALDPLIRHDMQDELLRLQRELRRTIVFITHDFSEALRLGERIAVMKDGVFEQVGTAEDVVARPQTDYVRAFTRDVPRSKVLRVRTVMSECADAADRSPSLREIDADACVDELIPHFLLDPARVRVVADGVTIGIVEPHHVATVLASGNGASTRTAVGSIVAVVPPVSAVASVVASVGGA